LTTNIIDNVLKIGDEYYANLIQDLIEIDKFKSYFLHPEETLGILKLDDEELLISVPTDFNEQILMNC
jgi:hypothetical protein